jgi:hypothetical protein
MQQSNINLFGSYAEAMFNTESYTLVTTACSVTFVNVHRACHHQILQEWNKKFMLVKYCNAVDQKIGNDLSIWLPIPRSILPPKEYKINKELVMFRNNQRNRRPFLTLNVGQTFI